VQIGLTSVTRCTVSLPRAIRKHYPEFDPRNRLVIHPFTVCFALLSGTSRKGVCLLGRGSTRNFRDNQATVSAVVTLLETSLLYVAVQQVLSPGRGELARLPPPYFLYIREVFVNGRCEIESTPSSVSCVVRSSSPASPFIDMPPPGPPPPGPPPPGGPPPGGLCGLTSDQWQMLLKFSIPCK
jgi:hypothetical protein